MKRTFLAILCVSLVVLGIAGNASAFAWYTDFEVGPGSYSGQYLFTVTEPKNDNPNQWDADNRAAIITAINEAIGYDYLSLDLFGKYPDNDDLIDATFNAENFEESYMGTWATKTGENVEFYTVKGATEWALYWLGEGGANEGFWSTAHLQNNGGNIPTISHFSLWNATTPENPIPEPSTVFLLGLGLLGILGLGRKFKK